MFDGNDDRDPIRRLSGAPLTPPSQGEAQAVPEVLTPDEAADLLRMSRRTLERLRVPSVKLGRLRRYLRQQILEWLEAKAR